MKNLCLGNIQSKILFFIAVVSVPIANVVVTNLKEKNIDIFDTLSSFSSYNTILNNSIFIKNYIKFENEKLIISASMYFIFLFTILKFILVNF